MKKLFNKSKNKNTLFGLSLGLLLGGIIFGSIGVVAVTLTADQISYTPNDSSFSVNNTKAAIDSLYDMALNNSQKVVYLGTGTSFDIKAITGLTDEEVAKLTKENFIVEISGTSMSNAISSNCKAGNHSYTDKQATGTTSTSLSIVKNYDATTGVLTAYGTLNTTTTKTGGNSNLTLSGGSGSTTASCTAYLIY